MPLSRQKNAFLMYKTCILPMDQEKRVPLLFDEETELGKKRIYRKMNFQMDFPPQAATNALRSASCPGSAHHSRSGCH